MKEQKKSKILKILQLTTMSVLFFVAGAILGSQLFPVQEYSFSSYGTQYEGCFCRNTYGDWVCVNVEDMSYKRALEVCKHETFHEIWSECGESNNLTYCIKKHEEEKGEYVTIL